MSNSAKCTPPPKNIYLFRPEKCGQCTNQHLYYTHILRVQRCAQTDHAQVAGRQQVKILAQRLGGGSGNLLGQLGHVHRVLVVVGLVVRLREYRTIGI